MSSPQRNLAQARRRSLMSSPQRNLYCRFAQILSLLLLTVLTWPRAATASSRGLNGLPAVPYKAATSTVARFCTGTTPSVSSVEDSHLAGSVLHRVQRKGQGRQNPAEIRLGYCCGYRHAPC